MSTGLKETIQNRATNQSAAWAIIAAIVSPLLGFFMENGFGIDASIPNMIFSFALIFMLLMFIANDKKAEHGNASAALTEPKILEQLTVRFASLMQGFADTFKDYSETLEPKIVYIEKDTNVTEIPEVVHYSVTTDGNTEVKSTYPM